MKNENLCVCKKKDICSEYNPKYCNDVYKANPDLSCFIKNTTKMIYTVQECIDFDGCYTIAAFTLEYDACAYAEMRNHYRRYDVRGDSRCICCDFVVEAMPIDYVGDLWYQIESE
jgi:hypothetical protein